jgi:hypothetical protein
MGDGRGTLRLDMSDGAVTIVLGAVIVVGTVALLLMIRSSLR